MERAVLETKALIRPNKTEDYSLFASFPDDAALMLSVQCQGLLAARLILHCDGLSSPAGEVYREYILTPNASCFSVLLTAEELRDLSPGGLYYYRYSLSFPDGTEEYGGEGATLLEKAALAGDRQLLLYAHDFRTPSFLKQGILYHIFVDRFAASGKCPLRKGSRLNRDWENGIPEYPPIPVPRRIIGSFSAAIFTASSASSPTWPPWELPASTFLPFLNRPPTINMILRITARWMLPSAARKLFAS